MHSNASMVFSPRGGSEGVRLSVLLDPQGTTDAVLVIDEADSFLFPREKAAHSWETHRLTSFDRPRRVPGVLHLHHKPPGEYGPGCHAPV
ncbi:MAG: hypothetical protein RBR38_13325 [Desulfomicrobium apsheronum]|nr:hypothetical protein [Desulfomicrobium apsheronum]